MSRHSRPSGRLALVALAGTGAFLLAGGPAHAATGSVSGSTVTYLAGKGEVNDVEVTASGTRAVQISDAGAAIVAGAGCHATSDPHVIVCPTEPGSSLNLVGADGPDTLRNATKLPSVLAGGSEADVLLGGTAADSLAGGAGDDTLDGGTGPDTFDGGGGRDLADYGSRTGAVKLSIDGVANDGGKLEGDALLASIEDLHGGAGADTLSGSTVANRLEGGGGSDTASYADRTSGLSLTLDGLANDGATGEGDLLDVENLIAGKAADTLIGDEHDNELDGGRGGDELQGGDGADTATYATRTAAVSLTPGLGDHNDGEASEGDEISVDIERLVGGSAPDVITKFAGTDHVLIGNGGGDKLQLGVGTAGGVIDGGDGDDLMLGGNGTDVLNGGPGPDTIIAFGAADQLDGGDGDDVLFGDAGDDQVRGGPGNDQIEDGGQPSGADDSQGGEGRDRYHAPRQASVTIRLNDLADDGGAGEGDNVHTDIESVLTGSGDDTLVGSPDAEKLDAGPGDDSIDGRGGADQLYGRDGDDDILSLDGVLDTVSCGGSPLDSLVADAGDDVPLDDCLLRTNG